MKRGGARNPAVSIEEIQRILRKPASFLLHNRVKLFRGKTRKPLRHKGFRKCPKIAKTLNPLRYNGFRVF